MFLQYTPFWFDIANHPEGFATICVYPSTSTVPTYQLRYGSVAQNPIWVRFSFELAFLLLVSFSNCIFLYLYFMYNIG